MSDLRQHFVLVPGFGGFDMLGSLRYYHGVLPLLAADPQVTVHFFPNLPTAAVATRARALRVWIRKRVERRAIRSEDRLHLIGHSTGGLDIRQLLTDEHLLGADALLSQVDSVQCLSTPHRGSNLVRWLGPSRLFVRPGLRAASAALELDDTRLFAWLAERLRGALNRWIAPRRQPGWGAALLDAFDRMRPDRGADGYARALARETHYQTQRWLEELMMDNSAVADLQPGDGQPPTEGTPVRWPARRRAAEAEALERHVIRARSLVTCAPPGAAAGLVYRGLHRLVEARAPDGLAPAGCREPLSVRALESDARIDLGRGDNDGVVNSVSMIWPDLASSRIVEGDHADIIGHYRYDSDAGDDQAAYDLLRSGVAFSEERFAAVWNGVREFALGAC